jgi:hypothetical protein
VEPARSRIVITWPDEVLITLISHPAPHTVVVVLPPLLVELLLELLVELLLELLLLELVLELLLLELLLLELLLELPPPTVVPAMTVGTVGMPDAGSRDALTATLFVASDSRSAAFSWPSAFTSIGEAPRREPVSGSRSKMKPEPPSSQEMLDGISVANTILPVDRNGWSFTRSPVPVAENDGVIWSAAFGKSRYQPRSGVTANEPADSGPGEVA